MPFLKKTQEYLHPGYFVTKDPQQEIDGSTSKGVIEECVVKKLFTISWKGYWKPKG